MEPLVRNKQFQEIRKKVQNTSIHISDVTKDTKKRFLDFAGKEFKHQYGWTLKWLMDFRDGILEHPNQQLSDKIDLLADEINKIKQSFEKPKEPEAKVKTVSGRIIGKRRNENEQTNSLTRQSKEI